MALTRPSTPFKDKTNVNPVGTRSQEATAEDFQEAGLLFDEYANAIEALQISESSNPYYGKWLTLLALQTAYPSAIDDAWAIIDEGPGITPQIAAWDDIGEVWELVTATEEVIFVANVTALPAPGTSSRLYITKDEGLAFFWFSAAYVQLGGNTYATLANLATKVTINDTEKLKVKIDGYWVDKNGNTDAEAWEVGDLFDGWATSSRYVVGKVIALPFDVDDTAKVSLAIDNTII